VDGKPEMTKWEIIAAVLFIGFTSLIIVSVVGYLGADRVKNAGRTVRQFLFTFLR
jgi:Sec-independent protein translocase protein TatA